nr:MAG TPA: Transcription initiation factor IIE, alpha FINGER, Transcription [Caudoviricetes sp.]
MNIINNGNIKCMYQYTTFTCPVCGCSFEYADIFADDFMSECSVHFDHIDAKCPCCNTPVRNYFKDTEAYPIARVIFYDQLKKKQEENLDTITKAREQFFSNHKERMTQLQEAFDNLAESYEDQKEINKRIEENRKALEDLLK